MVKGIISKILILLTVFILCPIYAKAEETEFLGHMDDGVSIPAYKEVVTYKSSLRSEELPQRYPDVSINEIANYEEFPKIRNQSPYGTCWAFAGLAALEINMIKNGYATRNDGLDFSVLHLAYYTYNSVMDPLEGFKGDEFSLNNYLNLGGYYLRVTNVIFDGIGPYSEDMVPYMKTSDQSMIDDLKSGTLAYKDRVAGLKGYYSCEFVDEVKNGNTQGKDITIDDSDIKSIKKLIMNYGAVTIGIDGGSSQDVYFYGGTLPQNTQGTWPSVNHDVVIVGWDDNIAKEKFNDAGVTRNGAWIMRNSRGKSAGINGYFYVSYCETNMSQFTVYEACEEDYDNVYEYDGAGETSSQFENRGNDGKYMNVFKPGPDESLKEIKFEVMNLNGLANTYSVDIYKGVLTNEDGYRPGTGTLVKHIDGTLKGYGAEGITETFGPIALENEPFSVVITVPGEIYVRQDGPKGSSGINFGWSNYAQDGKPYGEYVSFYKEDPAGDYEAQDYNYHIKAFTEYSGTGDFVESIVLSQNEINLKKNDTFKLDYTISPLDLKDATVFFYSDNKNVADVDILTGVVKAKSVGTATITCVSRVGQVKDKCKVNVIGTVESIDIRKITEASSTIRKGYEGYCIGFSYTTTGTNIPEFEISSSDSSILKILSWERDDKTGDFRIKAKALGIGSVKITVKAKDMEGLSKYIVVDVGRAKYTIDFTVSNASISSKQSRFYYGGIKETLYDARCTRPGDIFEGWFLDSKFKKPIREITEDMDGDLHLYGKVKTFEIKEINALSKGLEIVWEKPQRASGYEIYRKEGNSSFAIIGRVKNASDCRFTDKTAKEGVLYQYKVKVTDKGASKSVKAVKGLYLSAPKITGLTAGKRKLTVSYNRKKCSGYEIRYSTDSKFSEDKTLYKKVKKPAEVKVTLSKLKKGKYYVSVRSFQKKSSKTYYSAWSTKKKIKVK